jgi:hypothetical protein
MNVFIAVSVAAVVAGGLLMAFSARRPNRLVSWASAYLVLIVGAVQFGLIISWGALGSPFVELALVALGLYNLGNLCILPGTVLKSRLTHYSKIVNAGGGLLALAMALLVWTIRDTEISWSFAWFMALVLIILIGMPTGLLMSAYRKKHA